jgi:hypothetical protein
MTGFSDPLDPRLERRYWKLVAEHSTSLKTLAAGVRALPGAGKAFASTQALWRFLGNGRMSPARLIQPLRHHARRCLEAERPSFVLAVHDWSQLPLRDHLGKADRVALHSAKWNLGYELLTTLLVSAETGRPIAPAAMALEASDGVHATYSPSVQPGQSHLDALRPMMRAAEGVAGVRCVHVIDREGNGCFICVNGRGGIGSSSCGRITADS